MVPTGSAELILLQLLLNFLSPSLLVAAAEAASYCGWKRHWAAWQQQQAGRGYFGQGGSARSTSSGGRAKQQGALHAAAVAGQPAAPLYPPTKLPGGAHL